MEMDLVRFKKLFTALHQSDESTRNAAGKHLYDWMTDNNVHPDDLIVEVRGESHERTKRVLNRLEEENVQLRRENAFLRASAKDAVRKKAAKAGLIDNRWGELEELARQRLKVTDLPKGWQARVMMMIGASKAQMTAWRQGLSKIPDTVFATLKVANVPAMTPRIRGRPPKLNGKAPPPAEQTQIDGI